MLPILKPSLILTYVHLNALQETLNDLSHVQSFIYIKPPHSSHLESGIRSEEIHISCIGIDGFGFPLGYMTYVLISEMAEKGRG